MKLPVHCLQPLLIHMGVNLSGRDVGVSEHFLDYPEIRPVTQQMGGETVAKEVRIDVRLQSGPAGPILYDLPDPRTC
jgi:hypothetical protein